MLIKRFLCILILPFCDSLVSFGDVRWDKSRVDLRKGDIVNITCQTGIRNYFDAVRVHLTTDLGINDTVCDGKDVKNAFSKMSRLKVVHVVDDDNIASTTLVFTGIEGEDSGTYSCFKLSDPNKKADVHIHVHVPVKSVAWSNEAIPSSDASHSASAEMLQMREAEESSISCVVVVEGTIDPPEVKVVLDDAHDITSYFTEFEGPKVHRSEDGHMKLHSISRLTYTTMHPAPLHKGRNITCIAQSDRHGDGTTLVRNATGRSLFYGPTSATARLDISFGPIFVCEKYVVQVALHGNASVSCSVESNPPSVINWTTPHSTNSSTLPRVQIVRKQQAESYKQQMEFVISDVEDTHIAAYHLTATNNIATQEATILVSSTRPIPGTHRDGGGPNVAAVARPTRFDALTGSMSSPYSVLSTIVSLIASIMFCIILH